MGAKAFAFKIFISNSNSLYVIQTDFCAGSAKTIQIIHSLRHFLNLQFLISKFLNYSFEFLIRLIWKFRNLCFEFWMLVWFRFRNFETIYLNFRFSLKKRCRRFCRNARRTYVRRCRAKHLWLRTINVVRQPHFWFANHICGSPTTFVVRQPQMNHKCGSPTTNVVHFKFWNPFGEFYS